jgi:hypothetical protein
VYSTPTENDDNFRHVSGYIHRFNRTCEGKSKKIMHFCSLPHILEIMRQKKEMSFTKTLKNGKNETMK